ncbi:hypothetical protein ACFZDM_33515 [Streptomyces californicus]|uniref:hypothetical protein n=1 Tax=Streptomyces californicus TaxID=67351 RepID=UPI0036E24E0C
MPDTSPTPADQLRAALGRATELHERFEGSTCGTCADADGQAAAWPCETASALEVARQLLGTSTGEDTAAAPPAPAARPDLPDRLKAVLTERFTARGNPFSEMRRQEKGADGWPASHPVGPHGVAEVLRELLADEQPPAPADRAAVLRAEADRLNATDEATSPRLAAGITWATSELRRLAGEAAAEAYPARHQWRTETHDPLADEWNQGMPYTERADAVARHQTREERVPTWKDGTRVQRRLVRMTTTYTVEPTPAVPAAPEETQ